MNHLNSRTADKFVIRLPDGMREQIAETAKINHRSMNSEIIAVLADHLDAFHEDSPESPKKTTAEAGWTPIHGMYVQTPDGVGAIEKLEVTFDGSIYITVDGARWSHDNLSPIRL